MLKTLKIIGILVIVLIGILIRNTLTLNSKQVASAPLETITFPDDIFESFTILLEERIKNSNNADALEFLYDYLN